MAHQSHQWHPPPPQYAAPPFQYSPQVQTPSQQHFQYNPSAPSPSTRQQYAYPPPINQSRFDANGQIPSPNGIPSQYSSAGFNPALFHQFGSSNLPPPPPPSFPPIPLPNGNFSPFIPPPQVSNNFQIQYLPHGQATQANMPPQQYRTAEQPAYNMEQRRLPHSEKHKEMDMNDREMADIRANATTMATQAFGQNNNSAHVGMLQHQKVDITVAASSDRTDSVSSYNPPSATPPESGETAVDSSNAAHIVNIPVGEPSKYQGRGAFEMRELAKGALLSLAPHNIKFSDLLAEGIDAQLLSELFEEVGLKTTPNTKSKPNPSNALLTVESRAAQPVRSLPSFATHLTSDAQLSVGVKEPAVLAASAPPATGTALRQQASNPVNTALAATKAAENQPSAGPTMERKDVIAAMLAAKMGKPIPRKESLGAAPLGLPANFTPVPSTSASDAAGPPQSVLSNFKHISSQAVADEPMNKPTTKPKSKAQTELVRQKMEQLKRESAAKAHAQEASQEPRSLSQSPSTSRSTSSLVNGLSTYPQASLPPKPVSQEVVMGNTQTPSVAWSTTRQSVSSPAPPLSATFTSSIPGLFMMDADPDPVFVPSLEQGASTAQLATLNNTNRVEPVLSSVATYGTQTQQLVALDLGAVSRETSSSRVPSKRPLAIDAFDGEDLPPAKLQDSRLTSSREKDSASADSYSDDVSEGEIMEIDDGSPVSPLPRVPGSRSFPVPSDAHTTWPAPSNPASPTTSRQGNVSGLGSTEASYRASVNGQRTAASSKHELELEAMKKKLAEAEERRKAKQNALRVHSPSSSPVNQPLLSTSSSTVALSTVNAMPVTGGRLQHSPQSNSAAQGNVQPLLNTFESKSPKPSAPIDSVQRAKELREKLLRQRMLKQGLPELDKEVQKTQSRQADAKAKLAQLRCEAEKREEEAREARKREQEIMEEVKRLEQQLEMGTNGQQQFSQEMETLDQEMSPQVVQSTEQESEPQSIVNQVPSMRTTAANVLRDATFEAQQSLDHVNELTPEQDNAPQSGDSISDSEEEPMRQDYDNRLVRPSAEAAFPTAEEEVAFLEPAIGDESVSDEEGLVFSEDSYHRQEADVSHRESDMSDCDDSPMEVDSDSDGSASMSDSGSEDYQPAEPIISTETLEPVDDEDEEYDPMDAPISGAPLLLHEDDQEDYEPSEAVEPLEVQSTPPAAPQEQTGSPVSNGTTSENKPEHGDDREHGVELTEANTLTNPQELLPSVSDAADTNNVPCASKPSTSRFTPYQSVLSNFKSYRFNPQFTDRIPDGYRSLTYSNTINPTKPLCPTEADGRMCNDVHCEEQHFRQMSLADEKILVQMSSANDIPDKTQRDRFLAGLKLVIADLTTKQVSDFDTVASELAAYRRRFRQEQDPSLAFTSDEL